ncbi:hypothetical protein [Streptomyces sp. NPDC002785]|uniref:hypothetical protein n=1 Tax=Streptomyces sp. NPDC002785 TaxID=3154543 RepID=UPI00332740EC
MGRRRACPYVRGADSSVLAEHSRAHDPARVAAARLLPHAQTATVPGATHHTLSLHEPMATELNRRIEDFLMTR